MELTYVMIALTGGLAPALFWVWFWLREDSARPEPYRLILITFISGMVIVPAALLLQKQALGLYEDAVLVAVWVTIEEVLKYAAVLAVVLWNRAVDEPIDYMIYLIVVALGFSSLENALFIFNPLVAGDLTNSFITGNFRFLGASLLHVLASGTVGVFLAFAFYKSRTLKLVYGTVGLLVAIILHGLFNYFITESDGEMILSVFLVVWVGIIVLFMLFEKVKVLRKPKRKLKRT